MAILTDILAYTTLTLFLAAALATTGLWSYLTLRQWGLQAPQLTSAPRAPREPARSATHQLAKA